MLKYSLLIPYIKAIEKENELYRIFYPKMLDMNKRFYEINQELRELLKCVNADGFVKTKIHPDDCQCLYCRIERALTKG